MSDSALPRLARRATGGATGQHATKLDRSVHSGWVAELLREAIIDGRLQPGAPLVELRLAEQLEVSRGPVRNALGVLEGEGRVRTLPNGRMAVVGFDTRDIEDLATVRLELESASVERGIRIGADTAPVQAAFAALEQEADSAARLVELDVAFHRTLVELAGSRFLTQAWLALAPIIHAVITIGNRRLDARDPQRNFARIRDAHRPLAAAVAAGDAPRALALLTAQFDVTTSMFTTRDSETRQ